MLIVDNLFVNYGNGDVLSCFNFTFEENNIYGIIGENGVGKSTLLNAISNIISYKGNIYSDTKDNYLKYFSYLPSDLFFYPKMKGKEYILFFLKAKKITFIDINNWNEKFKLPLEGYISSYSAGMKKKLAIMAILMINSNFILLDEPFNSLDTTAVEITINLLLESNRKSKNTIIITSHNLEYLKSLCSKIYYLKNDSSLTLVS